MTNIVIQVEHLSKLYRIGKAQQRHDTLRDAISDFARRPLFRPAKGVRDYRNSKSDIRNSPGGNPGMRFRMGDTDWVGVAGPARAVDRGHA